MTPAGGDDGYHAAYREFDPAASDVRTEVRYQRYSSDFVPIGPSHTLLPGGEDPRCFS